MVGGGIFKPADTVRPMRSVIPSGIRWEQAAVTEFDPQHDQVVLSDGRRLGYRMLVAAPASNSTGPESKALRNRSAAMA